MKASMSTAIDTLWSNQVMCSVETELDNPHLPTTRHLATLMAEALQVLTEELRAENERAGMALADLNRRQAQIDDRETAAEKRERELARREREAGNHESRLGAREDQEDERERREAERHEERRR